MAELKGSSIPILFRAFLSSIPQSSSLFVAEAVAKCDRSSWLSSLQHAIV